MSLIFSPAKPGDEKFLIAFVGPSGSGKTNSALRCARGLAGPNGKIAFLDTENRRGLSYARQFEFDHADLREPFRPEKFIEAVEIASAARYDVLCVDSMSHEWLSLRDWHEEELDRMAGADYAKRERMTYAAWIKPKMAHKAMMRRLLGLNAHIIFCLRAEPKIELRKNDRGKLEPVDLGFQPICGKDFMFDMTFSVMLSPDNPGVPQPIKVQGQHRGLFEAGKVIDEAFGVRVAAYARGEDMVPKQPKRASEVAKELIDRFKAVRTRIEHDALYQEPETQTRLNWMRDNKPDLFARINDAMGESFQRTEGTEGTEPELASEAA